jgi:hypothetical protein
VWLWLLELKEVILEIRLCYILKTRFYPFTLLYIKI